MKILMIAPEPFFQPRGTPISVSQRLQALSEMGHAVDLLTYHLGKNVDIPNIKICRIPEVPFLKEVKIGPSWVKLFLDVMLFVKAVTMLIQKQYDLIHSHEEAAFFGAVLKVVFRTPHLYDMHSSLPRQMRNSKFRNFRLITMIFDTLEKWTLRSCDALITIDGELGHYATKRSPSVRHVIIENLPIQVSTPNNDRSLTDALREKLKVNGKLPIVYTGNFEPYQGIGLLLKSAEIVRSHNPGVIFIFVGGSHQVIQWWKDEAQRRNLTDCALFVGAVSPDEIPAYLSVAEILVSPRTEGTSVPLKAYTYLYSGKPIVATNLPAHTMVLNDACAVLVAPTSEAIAEGILELIRNPALRKRLGEKAQAFARKKFGLAAYRGKLDHIYRLSQTPQSSSKRRTQTFARN